MPHLRGIGILTVFLCFLKWNNKVRPLLLGDPAVQNC